jgi:hypothetical protein
MLTAQVVVAYRVAFVEAAAAVKAIMAEAASVAYM